MGTRMRQRKKKQVGARYVAKVRGAFLKLRVPHRLGGVVCAPNAAVSK